MTDRVATLIRSMKALANDKQRQTLMRFFKTDKGEYGENDIFLGLMNPQTRSFVKQYSDLELDEVQALVDSEFHEIRMCGFLILVELYHKQQSARRINELDSMATRDAIINFYIKNSRRANNWDLVDLSTPKLLGCWMTERTIVDLPDKEDAIQRLAESDNLWQQRMSIVFTTATAHKGMPEYTIKYAKFHLHNPHDLMHKAVGWMLRELGKQCGMDILRDFLADYHAEMPRTTLRYAIEHMDEKERAYWMNIGK